MKEQKIRHQLAEYANEITRILEIIRAGEAELETLKPETGTQLQVGKEIFQETHTEFLYFDKRGGIFFVQNSQSHNFFQAENSWEKTQQFWKKLEFLTTIKSQLLVWLNSRYS